MEHRPSINLGLAGVVKSRLAESGTSLREASTITGIPLTTLSRRLTGSSPFSADELASFARLFDTTVSGLAGEAELLVAADEVKSA